jgi:hypothetical protein
LRVARAMRGRCKSWIARGDVEWEMGAGRVWAASGCVDVSCGKNGVGMRNIALVGYGIDV